MSGQSTTTVVVDSSVLINLVHVQALAILEQLRPLSFVVPEEVVMELARPESRAALEQAIDRGWISVVPLTGPAELQLFGEARQRVEVGESACLALARSRGWRIACDEKKSFRALAEEWLGEDRVLGTLGLVVLLLRRGPLTLHQADGFLQVWERNRFRVAIRSFQELLDRS